MPFALKAGMPAPPSSQPDTRRSPAARSPAESGVPEHGYGYGGGPLEQGPATYGDEFGDFEAAQLRGSVNRETGPQRADRLARGEKVDYSSELFESPPAPVPPDERHLSPTELGERVQKARSFAWARDVGVNLMVVAVLLGILGVVLAAFLQVFLAIPVLLVAGGLFAMAKRAAKRSAERAREHQRWFSEDELEDDY